MPLLPFGDGGDFAASSCRWQRADYSSSPLSFDPEHLDPRQGLALQSVWALSAGRPGHFNARYIYQKRRSGRGPFPEPHGAMIAVE